MIILPPEIQVNITDFLPLKDVCSLLSTCSFFHNHEAIYRYLAKKFPCTPQIVAAGYSTFLLDAAGDVYACGSNASGQLGLGDTINRHKFTKIPDFGNVQKVISSGYHTFFIKTDNSIWACGWNMNGELGLGDKTQRLSPERVPVKSVKDITVHLSGTKFLMKNGTVLTCGWNSANESGLNDQENTLTPTPIKDLEGVMQIFAGSHHGFLVKEDNSIWCFGENFIGQLGLGHEKGCVKPTLVDVNDAQQIAVNGHHTFILKKDGSVLACGSNYFGQLGLKETVSNFSNVSSLTPVPGLETVINIVPGQYHTFFVEKNNIRSCGDLAFGKRGNQIHTHSLAELKLPEGTTACSQISAGEEHTIILTADNCVWGLGANSAGQLGLDSEIENVNEPTLLYKLPGPPSALLNKFKKISEDEEDNPLERNSAIKYK